MLGNTCFMRSTEKTEKRIKKTFRIADTMLFSFLLMLSVLPYIESSVHKWILIPVYFSIATTVVLFRKRYRSRIVRKRTLEIKEQQQIERILLLSDEELSERFGKQQFILIRKEHPDRFDVMEAIRKQADAIGLFSEDAALRDLILSYSPQTTVFLRRDLICGFYDDTNTEHAVKERFSDKVLLKYNRYFLLGILFLAASFIVRSKIYYRMTASVCLIIAAVSGIFGDWKRHKNLPIFLDKKDD